MSAHPRPRAGARAPAGTARRPGAAPMPRAAVVLLGLAAAVVVVAGLRAAAFLAGPLLLGLVLVVAVHPLRLRLDAHLPRWLSSTICFTLLIALLVGLGASIVVAAARFTSLVATYRPDWEDGTGRISDRLRDLGVDEQQVRSLVDGLDVSGLGSAVGSVVSGVVSVVSLVALVVTLILFMTFDGAAFADHVARLRRSRPALADALEHFAWVTRRYIVVSTVFGLVVAALDTVALAVLGLPAPLLWGLLAFLTNYIPNIGFVIGLVPPAVLGLLEGGPKEMLTVIAIYSVLNVVIQSVIQPKVVGDAVGLSTTLTFVSLVLWSWVLGPLGAVLAVPLSLLVRALLVEADPAAHWLEPLVANRPVPKAPPGSPAAPPAAPPAPSRWRPRRRHDA